jgi:putative transposase
MARPKRVAIRRTLRKLFPAWQLRDWAREQGAVERLRKVDPAALFWSVVLGFGGGRKRTLAGLRRAYEKATRQRIEESSFYGHFNAGFVRLLRSAMERALQEAVGIGRKLTGPLAAFRDLVLTDGTVVRLHDLLAKTYPGCRTNHSKAALKLHAVLSVTGAGDQSVKVTDGRRHDGPVFTVGPWVAGKLLLFDLGYFRYQLFASITRNTGYFVSRLKAHANPTIVAVHRSWRGRSVPVVGQKLQDVIGRLKREILDVTVEVSFPRRRYGGRVHHDTQRLRVVGIRDPRSGQYHLYVTNVPPEKLAAEDVQAVYAARWEVELLFKELKSHYRLEDMPSRKREVVEALLYAAMLTLLCSRALLALLRQKQPEHADRFRSQRSAAVVAAIAHDLLWLLVRPPREHSGLEAELSELLLHEALDPHRDRPSLLRAVETRRHAYRRKAA